MTGARRETVIVVHGTWASPSSGERHWYQHPDPATGVDNFVSKLNRGLGRRGSRARCWAHAIDHSDIFSWSGENSWIDRTRAAGALADYIDYLGARGWLCHIIAHSHGGNVVAEALPALVRSNAELQHIGRIVTLGTPFIDVLTAIERRKAKRERLVNALTWSAYGLLMALLVAYVVGIPFAGFADAGDAKLYAIVSALLAVLALLPLKPWLRRRRDTQSAPKMTIERASLQAFLRKTRPVMLSSPMDEAWQLLHHLGRIENPFAIQGGFLRHLATTWRNHLAQAREVARIHGIKSFRDLSAFGKFGCGVASVYLSMFIATPLLVLFGYGTQGQGGPRTLIEMLGIIGVLGAVIALVFLPLSVIFGSTFFSAMWTPLRWLGRILGAAGAVAGEIGGFAVRRKAWTMIQAKALGLEGYRLDWPQIDRIPVHLPRALLVCEDLAPAVVDRALAKRAAWLARHLGAASEAFANIALSPADLEGLQRTIAADASLVHAAYYSESDVINRIAECLAESNAAPSPVGHGIPSIDR